MKFEVKETDVLVNGYTGEVHIAHGIKEMYCDSNTRCAIVTGFASIEQARLACPIIKEHIQLPSYPHTIYINEFLNSIHEKTGKVYQI